MKSQVKLLILPGSPYMRKHVDILAELLEKRVGKQGAIAKALGYKSASAVGMMLRGERGMSLKLLQEMCELAGITIVYLASISDDLTVAKRKESVEAAAIMDDATPEELAVLMPLLRAYRKSKTDS
jgi:transcriptional regulator with XRE-family HTH domain